MQNVDNITESGSLDTLKVTSSHLQKMSRFMFNRTETEWHFKPTAFCLWYFDTNVRHEHVLFGTYDSTLLSDCFEGNHISQPPELNPLNWL